MPYEGTKVSIGQTQTTIRKMLLDFGVERVGFAEEFGARASVGVEFVFDNTLVRVTCPVDESDDARRVWRVVYWSLKSRFEAIDTGLEVFEQAFLAHVVNPATNRTIYDELRPAFDARMFTIGSPGVKALTR